MTKRTPRMRYLRYRDPNQGRLRRYEDWLAERATTLAISEEAVEDYLRQGIAPDRITRAATTLDLA